MSTPRSESIRSAHSSEYTPITPPAESLSRNKVDHYAGLARVMHEAFGRYVASDETLGHLYGSTSVASLRRRLAYALTDQAHAVLRSDEFTALHAGLQESQSARVALNPNIWQRIEDNLEAGAHTFVNTTEALYDAIEAQFSPAVARSPKNAAILDRLAKLNITQFIPYRDVYLETKSQRHLFADQLQSNGDGLRFKPGYPQAAVVPAVLVDAGPFRTDFADLDADRPLVAIGDIEPDRAVIGCPITFYKSQVLELWKIYVDARANLSVRAGIGTAALSSGGSAASSSTTA